MKCCMAAFEYSKYFQELKEDVKKRYEEKLKVADCTKDLYCYLQSKNTVSGFVEWSEWPDEMFADIFNYLAVTISLYTREQLKAYKNIDGYNLFINGWVDCVTVLSIGKQQNYLLLNILKVYQWHH